MFAEVRQLSSSVTQRQLEAAVTALCRDPRIDGVLLQLPLPRHIDEEAIIESFDPAKDVDGFHPLNMGGWVDGEGEGLQERVV
jgi:5,10-methylene-tetrahydrofolate dehydrogenase/methenyl tetrahydrofolate cyclohydrolase